jgi:hypothetical protein
MEENLYLAGGNGAFWVRKWWIQEKGNGKKRKCVAI